MHLTYETLAASSAVRDHGDLTIPAKATHALLQADTTDIRYTLDDETQPSQTTGMILLKTEPPELFLIEDICRIRWCRGSGSDGQLNIAYLAGVSV